MTVRQGLPLGAKRTQSAKKPTFRALFHAWRAAFDAAIADPNAAIPNAGLMGDALRRRVERSGKNPRLLLVPSVELAWCEKHDHLKNGPD